MPNITDQTSEPATVHLDEPTVAVLLAVAKHFRTVNPADVLEGTNLLECVSAAAYDLADRSLGGDERKTARAALTSLDIVLAAGHDWPDDDNDPAVPRITGIPGPRTEPISAKVPTQPLRAVCRDAAGRVLGEERMPSGMVQWLGDLPAGVGYDALRTVELTGTFTPRESGPHIFGTKGVGAFRLVVGGRTLFDGEQGADHADPFEAFLGSPAERGRVVLEAGTAVEVSLTCVVAKPDGAPIEAVGFCLLHREPERDAAELLAEAVAVAASADAVVVVVATTERIESEGFDRTTLALPGRQDELVARVAAVNPRTVVVVNSGSPVELPWRDDVAAVLLGWFPGQEAGGALADVLLGGREPGGRLPTTWPVRLADAPVTRVAPMDGELAYAEGVFIGYRAWEKARAAPAYAFGHGLGYTDWSYETLAIDMSGTETVRVRVRNTGSRSGREVVQVYLAVPPGDRAGRPVRRLAGFASVEAGPGETAEAVVALDPRAFEVWDDEAAGWRRIPGTYTAEAGRSIADRRLTALVEVG
ncbi:glycoside hydrolase family 3 C-terminal domain-containing protein [Streptomyces syringium]|uniref:glycoside hydrolase family 3 C-terminal domain-containing protein n=1 Tax=Streptomyces syringium TaxID=76729 RepID=UPI00367E9F4E